ncbi:sigma 54-interacting transcriptional regulator [Cellulosilyticum sp. I15G10I2]|uniref:sigma 54-interacting transcriptional regulator n=1 Tax=Cellulosilyticum sp. I15G10I2 TaxID=1892843 RepID=UPI00085C17BC|nr:sigma 54-interacting transcriptional regulator [Cellulosilyticum sp. I15G10I2]
MSGIALFVPDQDMYAQAENLIKNLKNNHISLLKLIHTEDATTEARNAIVDGINIIIARGRQAVEIKNNTNVTVTNIIVTAQELGLLIMKAKSLINKDHITIGLFGWGDMFCDTTYFEQLYNITLKRYILSDNEEWRNIILKSTGDQLDVIIGGKSVLECASQIGIPGIYLAGTGESLEVAIRSAESLYHMAEIEKHNYAQFSTVLDSSSNGIIKLSASGKLLIMNRIMEGIIGQDAKQLIGMSVGQLFTEISYDKIVDVLDGTSDNFSTLLTYHGQELVLIVEPIVVEKKIEGAIMSFNRLRRLNVADKETMSKQFLNGYVAHATFDDISKNMKGLRHVIERAKLYALSSSPMLVEALSGPELDIITQGIHNYGMRKNGPFIMINMAGMTEDQQIKALFGNTETKESGALLNADHGTLVIQSIDKLSLPIQYNFIKALRTRRLAPDNNPSSFKVFDTRIIACTAKNLMELRKNFLFRSDLYFTLNSLRLRISNLKDRPEDVAYLLTTYIKQYMQQYARYHVLSARAKKILLEYPWEGNSIQLQSFCERMILTAQSRNITEEYVHSLLTELYHSSSSIYEEPTVAKTKEEELAEKRVDPMYELIYKTLKKYNGSRKLVAKELQISTTTLWRKMKKYGLTDIY